MPADKGPLDGLLVLDFTRVLSGPYCTMLLADMGARVIKVEQPGRGDDTRAWGPPFINGESAYFLSVNRNKESLTLDLKHPSSRRVLDPLLQQAGVLVENFRPGTMERLGLGYEALAAGSPGLVYCSISGFGQTGPRREEAGYDAVMQGEAGLMSITGEPGGEPSKVGVAVVDVLAGLNAAIAILAGLRRRDRTGQGEHVEVSLLDSALSGLVNVAQNVLVTGEEAGRYGNTHRSVAPYQPLRAKSGSVAVAAANDGLFEKLCGALERNDLFDDPRFATNPERVEHRAELAEQLEETLASAPPDEWIERLNATGVPAGKIRGVLEALEAAADAGEPATVTVEHPSIGPLELVGTAPRLESSGMTAPVPPPLLGEHTREVLREVGLDETEVDAIVAAGSSAGFDR